MFAFLFGVSVFLFVLCSGTVYAQTENVVVPEVVQPAVAIETLSSPTNEISGDFVVGPGRTELVLKPGESKIVDLIVSNRTGVDKVFKFEIEDAAGSRDASKAIVLLGSDKGPFTLKDYVKLPFDRLDLKHNQRARIPVTITIPANAEPGGRYGTVLVTTVTKDDDANKDGGTAPSSVIVSRLGSHFFVQVPGDVLVDGELRAFSTIPDARVFSEGPIQFQLLYENKGNLHVNPYGEIRITNMLGEEVGFVTLDPWFVLPRALRAREVEWNRELLIGRYTAVAQINRGYDNIIDIKTLTFWVIPWDLLVYALLGLFGIVFCIRFVLKNFELKRKST